MSKLPPGRYVKPGKNGLEYLTRCPSCRKEKFYYSVEARMGYCQSCHHKMTRWDRFEGVKAPSEDFASQALEIPFLKPAMQDSNTKRYLEERVHNYDDLSLTEILADKMGETLYFPLTPIVEGFPRAFHTRHITRGWKIMGGTEKSNYVFGTAEERTILVEGIFDSLALGVKGALCLLGTSLSPQVMAYLESKAKTVVLWLDPDEAGIMGAAQIESMLERHTKIPDIRRVVHEHEPGDCTCLVRAKARFWLQTGE